MARILLALHGLGARGEVLRRADRARAAGRLLDVSLWSLIGDAVVTLEAGEVV
jgi:hypothetical protein